MKYASIVKEINILQDFKSGVLAISDLPVIRTFLTHFFFKCNIYILYKNAAEITTFSSKIIDEYIYFAMPFYKIYY